MRADTHRFALSILLVTRLFATRQLPGLTQAVRTAIPLPGLAILYKLQCYIHWIWDNSRNGNCLQETLTCLTQKVCKGYEERERENEGGRTQDDRGKEGERENDGVRWRETERGGQIENGR